MTDIHITVHVEADRLAAAIEILAAAILGTPASKAEGTQFQLQPVRGNEGADPAAVAAIVSEKLQATGVTPAAPPPAAGAKAIDLATVRAKLADKSKAGHTEAIKGLLKQFGATTLQSVPAEKYGELLAAVEAL